MSQRLLYLCGIVIFILNEKIYFITSNEIRRDNYDEKTIPLHEENRKYFDSHIGEAFDSKIKMQQRRNLKDNQIDDQSGLISTKSYNDMNDHYENRYIDETNSLKNSERFHDKEYQKKDQATLSSFINRNEYSNQNKYYDEEIYDSELVPRRYSDIDYQRNDQSNRYNDKKFKIERHYDNSNQFERNNNNNNKKDSNRYYNADVSRRSHQHDVDYIRHKRLNYSDSTGKISDSLKYTAIINENIDNKIERSEKYIDRGGYRYYREDHPTQNLRRDYELDKSINSNYINHHQRTSSNDDDGTIERSKLIPDSYHINVLHHQKLTAHFKSIMKNYSENTRFNILKDKIFKYKDKFNKNETIFIKNELYNLTLLGVHSYLLTNKTYFNNSSYFKMSTITVELNLTTYSSIKTHENSTNKYYHNNNNNNSNNSSNNNSTFNYIEKENLTIKDYRNEYAKKYVTLKSLVDRIIFRIRNNRNNEKYYIENIKNNNKDYHRNSAYNTPNKYKDKERIKIISN